MDLTEQVDRDVSALLETFPLSTSGEAVALARQAWFAGYKAGMDAMKALADDAFVRLERAL